MYCKYVKKRKVSKNVRMKFCIRDRIMNHKQSTLINNRINLNQMITNRNEETCYTGCLQKPLLLSSEDEEQMAVLSNKARLLLHLVSYPKNSKNYTQANQEDSPNYKKTSYKSAISTPTVATYPSFLQNIRRNPYVCSEDSQLHNQTEDVTCRCDMCKIEYCHTQDYFAGNKKSFHFKDNIMRFSDNSTMTWMLNDMGCGVRTPTAPTTNTSEVSISTSNIAVRDQSTTSLYQATPPAPILTTGKKHRGQVSFNSQCIKYNNCERLPKLIKKDTQNPQNIKNCPSYGSKKPFTTAYELIRYPPTAIKVKSLSKLKKSPHRITPKGIPDNKTVIPHAHIVHSKYHNTCNSFSNSNHSYDINDIVSRDVKKNIHKEILCDQPPLIRLPKRVLISKRNVDDFMSKCKSKTSVFKKLYTRNGS